MIEQMVIVDTNGNRLYEVFEHDGGLSGYDYTLIRTMSPEEVAVFSLMANKDIQKGSKFRFIK